MLYKICAWKILILVIFLRSLLCFLYVISQYWYSYLFNVGFLFQIERYDRLPKTVCESCIEKLEIQYKLVQKIRRNVAIQRTHRLYHVSETFLFCNRCILLLVYRVPQNWFWGSEAKINFQDSSLSIISPPNSQTT